MTLRKLSGKIALISFALIALATVLETGCSSGAASNMNNPVTTTGTSFVVGTDAPMASVTSFSVVVQSVDAIDASGNSVSLVSGSPTVDFARYNGLQALLDMNDVNAGTYTSVAITLGPATIGYLDTTGGGAPTIQTMPVTFPNSPEVVTIPLTNPLVVASSGAPVGLHVDFDLRKSIAVDETGQITGTVNPTFNVKAVTNSDPGAYIDEFDAAVVTPPAAGAQSFTVQGPHGRQFTVNVDGQTEWDGDASLSALTTSSIVQISGELDRADATIDADEVAILSQNGFYAAGQVTYVTPASGAASSFDLYVRGLLPTTTGLSLGQIAQVSLGGSEKYSIYWMHGPLAQFLFNQSGLLPGQHIAVGGPASGATDPQNVTVNRVTLRHWGYNGTIVAGSVNAGNDNFQMTVNGFAGLLVPGNVTVYVTDRTQFRDGLASMADVEGSANVRVVGLLLKDPVSGNLVLVAHCVDALN